MRACRFFLRDNLTLHKLVIWAQPKSFSELTYTCIRWFRLQNLPPIEPKQIDEIQRELKKFSEIHKFYGDWLSKALKDPNPRNYPIIKQFLTKNYKYLKIMNQVLSETATISGFATIIKHSKNKAEFYDELSILKLGRMLKSKGLTLEFIPPGEGPRPDLRADIWGKDVFFEIKHLRNVDEASNLLFDYFNEYPSKFFVSITLDTIVTMSQIQECIQTIKTVIETKREEDFPLRLNFGYAKIIIGLSKPSPKTSLAVSTGPQLIPFGRTKFKIEATFEEACEQLKTVPSSSPCFVVYDVDNWKIEFEDMARVFYGDGSTDISLVTLELQKALYNLKKETGLEVHQEKIVEAFRRNFYDILKDNLLIPRFSYSFQNGLFFLDKNEDINGIIAFRGNAHKLFPNPFVKDKRFIDYYQLTKTFPSNLVD